jgi:hypothetical protein
MTQQGKNVLLARLDDPIKRRKSCVNPLKLFAIGILLAVGPNHLPAFPRAFVFR